MAYQFGTFEIALAAAAGEDEQLMAELRGALFDSASDLADLLGRARCDANWHLAAHRLKGLAASFGASALIEAAQFALDGAPSDPVALRRVKTEVARLQG